MLTRIKLAICLVILCGCTSSQDRPRQAGATNHPKAGKAKKAGPPFLEHPSGDFETAADAMADAIKRLRALPEWDNWITFTAQGKGEQSDSCHFAEIRMKENELKLPTPMDIDIELTTKRAGVTASCLSKNGEVYSIATATPVQAARIMDVIYRQYLGIRPHAGEGHDYAVGAEW